MNKVDIKVGDKVEAIFVKYGKHLVSGEVFEISTDEHGLSGAWVSIKVTGGNAKDKYVVLMIERHINVMVPIIDVLKCLNEKED